MVERFHHDSAPDLSTTNPKGKQTMKLTKSELYRKPRWDVTAKENVVIEED